VMNLPHLDPDNAVLAPILAHEVAHIAADGWVQERLLPRLDADQLQRLFDQQVPTSKKLSRDAQRSAADYYLEHWLVEEICDAVACLVTGPAFLFAEAAFLPAPKSASFGDHPTPHDRIRWGLAYLDRLGWNGWMREHGTDCVEYLRALIADPPRREPAHFESFVRMAVDANTNVILAVAETIVGRPLTPESFAEADQRHELCASLKLGYMPPQLGQEPPTLWHVLLAAWAAWLDEKKTPESMAQAVADAAYNRFLIKALELVGISELWGSYDPAAT
jgi:hypothetical protein